MNLRDTCEKLAEAGTFQVKFRTDVPGVVIPEYLRAAHFCDLKFSKLFKPGGLGDLAISEVGLQQTLSFQGRDFECCVPYTAIYMPFNDEVTFATSGAHALPQVAEPNPDEGAEKLPSKGGLRLVVNNTEPDEP